MSHAQTSKSCSGVVRRQPQPASMSTSSQYYRSANPHSHYQTFPSNSHEQTYASYVGTWQDSNHTSYSGPSSGPLSHYSQAGLSSDFSNPRQPPAPPAWNAGYARPNLQEWSSSASNHVNEQSFAQRAGGSYHFAGGGASVQHIAPNVARPYPHQHHQQASEAEHEQPLTSSVNDFRDTERYAALRTTSVNVKSRYTTLSFD